MYIRGYSGSLFMNPYEWFKMAATGMEYHDNIGENIKLGAFQGHWLHI